MARTRSARSFWAAALCVVGLGVTPAASHAALAVLTGGSGTSGRLSSNPSIRKQELVCDPVNPSGGSYSVQYNPNIVSYDLGSLNAVPGYTITSGYIERNAGTATSPDPVLFDINTSAGFGLPETGYIQVFFQQDTTTPYQPPGVPAGYNRVDTEGVAGDETHGLTFSYLAGIPDTTFASYTIFADPGGRSRSDESFSPADSFTDPSGNVIPFNDITPSTVTGNLFVPEPASLGVLALGSAGLLLRRRKNRPL